MEKIICAAVNAFNKDFDKVFYGHRHSQCLDAMNNELSWTMNRQEINKVKKIQGFVTTEGRFVDRKEALKIALVNNQILENSQIYGEDLYSENLY